MWVRRGGEGSRDPQSWAQPRKPELPFPVLGEQGRGGAALRGVSLGTQGEAIQHWVCYTACDSRQREIKEAGVSKAE